MPANLLQVHFDAWAPFSGSAGHAFVRLTSDYVDMPEGSFGQYSGSGNQGGSSSAPHPLGSSGASVGSSTSGASQPDRGSAGAGSASPGGNQFTDGHVSRSNDACRRGDVVFFIELTDEEYMATYLWLMQISGANDGLSQGVGYTLVGGAGDGVDEESCVTFAIWVLRRATDLELRGLDRKGGLFPYFTPASLRDRMRAAEELKDRGSEKYQEVPWYEVDPGIAPLERLGPSMPPR